MPVNHKKEKTGESVFFFFLTIYMREIITVGGNTQVPAEHQVSKDEKWSDLDVNFQLEKLHQLIKMTSQEDIKLNKNNRH